MAVMLVVIILAMCRCAMGESAYLMLLNILIILNNRNMRAMRIALMSLSIFKMPPKPANVAPSSRNALAGGPDESVRSGMEARKSIHPRSCTM